MCGNADRAVVVGGMIKNAMMVESCSARGKKKQGKEDGDKKGISDDELCSHESKCIL
jgi:hypothetical protein